MTDKEQYWKDRCEKAEAYIELSPPCIPQPTTKQQLALYEWQKLRDKREPDNALRPVVAKRRPPKRKTVKRLCKDHKQDVMILFFANESDLNAVCAGKDAQMEEAAKAMAQCAIQAIIGEAQDIQDSQKKEERPDEVQ